MKEISNVAKCIFYWLNYNSSVSRSQQLIESSIRFPLVECIERLGKSVKLEVPHPYFEGHKLDFQIIDGESTSSIELKFLNPQTADKGERSRYLADLIRLASIDKEGSTNYFIVCGSTYNYKQLFKVAPFEITNKLIPDNSVDRKEKVPKNIDFANWLPTSDLEEEKQFIPAQYDKYSSWFHEKYKNNLPEYTISVKLIAKEEIINSGYIVLIWNVKKI